MAGHRVTFLKPLVLALGLGLSLAGSVRADYRLIDRGALNLPSGFQISAMSVEGVVVGTAPVAGANRAYVVQPGGVASAIPVPATSTSSQALAINAGGDIAGSFTDARFGNVAHAFRYTARGGFEDLGALSNGSAFGTAINSMGAVAGYGNLPGGGQRALTVSSNGTMTTIDPLGGGRSNYATGINGGGTVVGTSDVGNSTARAFIARSGEPAVDLLSLHPGSGFSGSTYATGINDRNSVIGYGGFGSGSHAFIAFEDGPMIDLGITGTARSSFARAINGSDQVVGTLDFGGGMTHAFFWDRTRAMVDLNNLLSAQERSSWVLTQALAIGEDGMITGLGYRDGQLRAFSIVGFGSVPEPSTALLMSLGLGAAAVGVRLRRGRSRGPADA